MTGRVCIQEVRSGRLLYLHQIELEKTPRVHWIEFKSRKPLKSVTVFTPNEVSVYVEVDFPDPIGRYKVVCVQPFRTGEPNQAFITVSWPETLVTIIS